MSVIVVAIAGRFVMQKQWKRWRAKRKFVPGSKHLEKGASAGTRGYHPGKFLKLYIQNRAV